MKLATQYAKSMGKDNTHVEIKTLFRCTLCMSYSGLMNDQDPTTRVLHIPHRHRRRDLCYNTSRTGMPIESFYTCLKLMVHHNHQNLVYVDKVTFDEANRNPFPKKIPMSSWRQQDPNTLILAIIALTTATNVSDPALLAFEIDKKILHIYEPINNRSDQYWEGTTRHVLRKWDLVNTSKGAPPVSLCYDPSLVEEDETTHDTNKECNKWRYRIVKMPEPKKDTPKPMPQAIVIRMLGNIMSSRPNPGRKEGQIDKSMTISNCFSSNQIRYNNEFSRGLEHAVGGNSISPLVLGPDNFDGNSDDDPVEVGFSRGTDKYEYQENVDLSDGGCSETWTTDGDILFIPCPKVGLEPKEVLLDSKLFKRDINRLLPTVVYCPDSCLCCNRALKTDTDSEVCTLIPCGHLVHGNCLQIRFKYHNVWCPQCGQKIKSNIHMFGAEKIEGHKKTAEESTTTNEGFPEEGHRKTVEDTTTTIEGRPEESSKKSPVSNKPSTLEQRGVETKYKPEVCSICMTRKVDCELFLCRHTFCRECVGDWMQRGHNTCMVCSQDIQSLLYFCPMTRSVQRTYTHPSEHKAIYQSPEGEKHKYQQWGGNNLSRSVAMPANWGNRSELPEERHRTEQTQHDNERTKDKRENPHGVWGGRNQNNVLSTARSPRTNEWGSQPEHDRPVYCQHGQNRFNDDHPGSRGSNTSDYHGSRHSHFDQDNQQTRRGVIERQDQHGYHDNHQDESRGRRDQIMENTYRDRKRRHDNQNQLSNRHSMDWRRFSGYNEHSREHTRHHSVYRDSHNQWSNRHPMDWERFPGYNEHSRHHLSLRDSHPGHNDHSRRTRQREPNRPSTDRGNSQPNQSPRREGEKDIHHTTASRGGQDGLSKLGWNSKDNQERDDRNRQSGQKATSSHQDECGQGEEIQSRDGNGSTDKQKGKECGKQEIVAYEQHGNSGDNGSKNANNTPDSDNPSSCHNDSVNQDDATQTKEGKDSTDKQKGSSKNNDDQMTKNDHNKGSSINTTAQTDQRIQDERGTKEIHESPIHGNHDDTDEQNTSPERKRKGCKTIGSSRGLPTNKQRRQEGLSKLTLTHETMKKYMRRQAEKPSHLTTKFSKPNESDHTEMCFFGIPDMDKVAKRLRDLLSLCLSSNDDRRMFGICYTKVLKDYDITPTDLQTIMGKLPNMYEQMKDMVGEVTEDPASHCCFEDNKLHVTECDPKFLTTRSPCAFLVECVLNRCQRHKGHRKYPKTVWSAFDDTIFHCRTSKKNCDDCMDHIFHDVIVIIPLAGIFYTSAMIMNTGYATSECTSSLVALPISWLRLRHSDGQPSGGAFLKKVVKCWCIDWTQSAKRVVHECYQASDVESGSPLWAPDHYTSEKSRPKMTPNDQHSLRVWYRETLLNKASANKTGCRKYVHGALYRNLSPPPDTSVRPLLFDVRETGEDTTFIVRTRGYAGKNETISHVKVTTLQQNDKNLLSLLHKRSCHFAQSGTLERSANARCNHGDMGTMTSVGVCTKTGGRSTFFSDKLFKISPNMMNILPKICGGVRRFCERKFPGVLSAFRHLETNFGLDVPNKLGGNERGVSSSIILSCDLMNASHYDIHDASVSFTIWTETNPGSTNDWYFVLPNVLIKHKDKTYHGLCIRLFHGIAIAWDGRIIRHGTSVHTHSIPPKDKNVGNHTIGWFFSTNARSLSATVTQNEDDNSHEIGGLASDQKSSDE